MERALLVIVNLESEAKQWPLEDTVAELKELALACNVEVAGCITAPRKNLTPNLFIGKGKVEEIALLCQTEEIGTIIFSHDLSGTQQRNLEEEVGCKVVDRTQLILDIFARRAKTPEGKMQVELAQLEYLLPRLAGKGIMLSRLGGGIGTRGPGEQKLETDRRKVRERIARLKEDLKHSLVHRKTLRKNRKEQMIPSIALVGYTNAGKSTLLNALTGSDQAANDALFTTLDTSSKSCDLPNGEQVVISDTVGFLNNLPHHLIEAFKATLEEVIEADLLIHVLDASHPRVYEKAESVKAVLEELEVENKPVITALNKIDQIDDKVWIERLREDFPNAAAISAKFKTNFSELFTKIEENFQARMEKIIAHIPISRMDLVDLLYKNGDVKEVKYLAKQVIIEVNIPKFIIAKYLKNIELE